MRLFAAVLLPKEAREKVKAASAPLHDALGVRLLGEENYHLTLRFIGEVKDSDAGKVEEALSAVAFSPFQVSLSGAGAYPSTHFPRAIYIGGQSKGAGELAAAIEGALLPFGLKKEKFSVHLTVARSKGAGDIEDFLSKTGEVCTFEARSFCLMKSTLMAHGASYDVLREYPAKE